MSKINKQTGEITTDDGCQIVFHGNEIEISTKNHKNSFYFEHLASGAIAIYKNNNTESNELLGILDKNLKEMEFLYEIV